MGQTTRAVGHNLEEARQGIGYYGEQAWLLVRDFRVDPGLLRVAGPWGIRLDPVVFGCFLVGFVLVWRFVWRREHFVLACGFCWFALVMVVLYRFTSDFREMGLFPWIYCMAALGLATMLRPMARFQPWSTAVASILIVASFGFYYRQYIYHQDIYNANSDAAIYSETAAQLATFASQGYEVVLPAAHLAYAHIEIQLPRGTRVSEYNPAVEMPLRLRSDPHVIVEVVSQPPSFEEQATSTEDVYTHPSGAEAHIIRDGRGFERVRFYVWR
jgi:hypothetical protein